jgi:hypothetical protein
VLEAQGYMIVGSTPEYLLETARAEARTLGEVIRSRGINLQ